MKFKKAMLVTIVLLAILTIGAVSAADDIKTNETLAVEDVDEVSIDASVDDNLVSSGGDEIVSASQEDVLSLGNTITITAKDIGVGGTAVIKCERSGDIGGDTIVRLGKYDDSDFYRQYKVNFSDDGHAAIEIPDLDVGIYFLHPTNSVAADISCTDYFRVLAISENGTMENTSIGTPTIVIGNNSDSVWINVSYPGSEHIEYSGIFADIDGRWFKYAKEGNAYGQWAVDHYSGNMEWYAPELGRFSGDVTVTARYYYEIGRYKNGNIKLGVVSKTESFSFKSPVEFIFPTGPLPFLNDTRVVSVKTPENTTGEFSFNLDGLLFIGSLENMRYSAEEDLHYLLIADFVEFMKEYEWHLSKLDDLRLNNSTYMWCSASYTDGNYSSTIDEAHILFHKLNLTITAENVKDTIVIRVFDDEGNVVGSVKGYTNKASPQKVDYTINGVKTQWATISDENNKEAVIRNLNPGYVVLNVHSDAGGSYDYPSSVYNLVYGTFYLRIRANPDIEVKAEDGNEGDLTTIEFTSHDNITANATLYVDGVARQVKINEGYGDFEIQLAPGYHNATLVFDGNDDFFEGDAYAGFVVYSNNRTDPNITVSIANEGMLFENDHIVLIITADEGLEDTIPYELEYLIFDDDMRTFVGSSMRNDVEIKDGRAIINQTYGYGAYSYQFKFEGNPFYLPDSAGVKFNVYRKPIDTNFMVMTLMDGRLYVGISDIFGSFIPNATISYSINGVSQGILDYNAVDGAKLPELDEPCEILFEYAGNETYSGCNYTYDYKPGPKLNVSVNESVIYENTPFKIIITANEDISDVLYVWLVDYFPVNLTKGYCEYDISGMQGGNYTCYVDFYGNENYSSGSVSMRIEVIGQSQNPPQDEIILWVMDGEELSTDSEDLPGIFANVKVPEGTSGNVTFTSNGNVLYNLALADFMDGRIDHENNIYNIALEVDGEFIFEGLESGDVVKYAFLDENGDEVASNQYRIYFTDNTVRFELYNGTDDQPEPMPYDEESHFIFVARNEIIIDSEDSDYDEDAVVAGIILPGDTAGGRFAIFNGDDEIFSQDVNEAGVNGWHNDEDGNLKFYALLKDFNLSELNDGDTLTFCFFDENGDEDERYTTESRITITDSYMEFCEDDEPTDEIEFEIIDSDESVNVSSSARVASLFIPATEEFEGANVTITVYKNGEVFTTIKSSDINPKFNEERGAYEYPISLDLSKFSGKDLIEFSLDCYDDVSWMVAVETDGDSIRLHDFDEGGMGIYVFYGNLTTGDLNDKDAMGLHPNGNFILMGLDESITEVTIALTAGDATLLSWELSDCDRQYDYSILGYEYSIKLSDIDISAIPKNTNLTFVFTSGDDTFRERRIIVNDYMFIINTPERIAEFISVEITDDAVTDADDDVVFFNATERLNPMSVWIDAGSGYFNIYVNGTKVEGLGYLLSFDDEDEIVVPDEIEFSALSHLHELYLSLADLGIDESGKYNIRITHYPGDVDVNDPEDSYFYPVETEVANSDIIVNLPESSAADPEFALSIDDVEYGKDVVIKVTADSAFTGNVTVEILGKPLIVAVTNGEGNITLSNLAANTYQAFLIYEGSPAFKADGDNTTFVVKKALSAISVDEKVTLRYGESRELDVKTTGAAGFAAQIDGVNISTAGGKIVIGNLDVGSHTLTITTIADENHTSATVTVAITVDKAASSITAASPTTTTYGTSKNIAVTLSADAGVSLKDKLITVTVGGKQCKGYTNANGVAYIAIPSNLAVKTYTATVTFDGDAALSKATTSVKVVVNKATPKLAAKAKAFKKSVKTKKYTVKLKTDKNAALKKVKVTIKVGKKTYSAKTLSSGKATFKITKLTKKGRYTATVKFAGNANYKAVTKKVKITVK